MAQRVGVLTDRHRIAAEIARENEQAQDKLIGTLRRQAEVFGKNERALAIYKLGLLDASEATKAYANSLFDQMEAQKRNAALLDEAATGQKNFTDLLAETRAAVQDFGKSDIEKQISKLVRAFKGAVLNKAVINQIRRAAAALANLKAGANAFDTLKQKALNLVRSTRTPMEKYLEQIALLNKMAKTIDPNTGKALIDTDTLNRGLKAALDNLNALKRAARPDSFISGQKREFVRQFGGGIVAAGQQAAKRGSTLFNQFGKKIPGGLFQGAPPGLFGGGRGTIHPRPITADTSTLGGGVTEAILSRIESLIMSGLTRTEMTRVN